MDNKKKHVLSAIGILSLILAILALFHYHHLQIESQRIVIEKRVSQTSNKQLSDVEEAIKRLEHDMTDENITEAQKALDQLKDSDAKTGLQKRIDVVRDYLATKQANEKLNNQAEEAVNHLEKTILVENLISAQEAVDKITDKELQERLQARINKVRGGLEARLQEPTPSEATTEIFIPQDNQNSSDNSSGTLGLENTDHQGLETSYANSPQTTPESGNTDPSVSETSSPIVGNTENENE
ncbi:MULTISPECIES: hypothetical protein [Streptococcus]|uniref:Lipoprotein n=1 Tax=Streptococcus caledonicus TaxID=2614158 RepID=A0ABW0UAI4_9STRE|nr:hypothetical protein [Streptococcus sp. S784/96/1]